MRVLRVGMMAALCTVGAVACSDSTSPFGDSASGTYYLDTVNGNQLPYIFSQGSSTVSIQADTYVLNNNGTYTETTQEQVSNGFGGSSVTQSEYGNWYQNNNAVEFDPVQSTRGSLSTYTGSLTGGTFSGGDLTISANGTVSIYSKQ